MTCPHCVKRPLIQINQYVGPTCGNSYCQQASYEANMARVKPKKRKVKK